MADEVRPGEQQEPPATEVQAGPDGQASGAREQATTAVEEEGYLLQQELEEAAPRVLGPALVVLLLALLLHMGLGRLMRARLGNRWKRWFPLGRVLVWAVAVLMVLFLMARTLEPGWLVVSLALVGVLLLAAGPLLRSVLAGLVLMVEGELSPGDRVRVGQVEGELVEMGARSVRVRSEEGALHEIPNEQMVGREVANLSMGGGDAACELEVVVPPEMTPLQAMERARQIAYLSPLASPRHRPEVFLESERAEADGQLRVRIRGFAFEADYRDHFRSDIIARWSTLTASRQEQR